MVPMQQVQIQKDPPRGTGGLETAGHPDHSIGMRKFLNEAREPVDSLDADADRLTAQMLRT